MLKKLELTAPDSCMSKAEDHEMLFVLLARDICAPIAIEAWVEARIASGKNQREDSQIREALDCARTMREQYLRKIVTKIANRA